MMAAGREREAHALERILGRIQVARRDDHVVYALDMFSHFVLLFCGRAIIIALATVAEGSLEVLYAILGGWFNPLVSTSCR